MQPGATARPDERPAIVARTRLFGRREKQGRQFPLSRLFAHHATENISEGQGDQKGGSDGRKKEGADELDVENADDVLEANEPLSVIATDDRLAVAFAAVDAANARAERRLVDFAKNMVDGIRVRRNPMREGLSEEEEAIFLKAITPGDPSNPFAPRNQIRNHALWLTYYDGGVRLGEGLGLKTIDCHLNGPKKKLIVHRRPDDPEDPRRKQALTKTLPHPVEIGARLVRVHAGHGEADADGRSVRRSGEGDDRSAGGGTPEGRQGPRTHSAVCAQPVRSHGRS